MVTTAVWATNGHKKDSGRETVNERGLGDKWSHKLRGQQMDAEGVLVTNGDKNGLGDKWSQKWCRRPMDAKGVLATNGDNSGL